MRFFVLCALAVVLATAPVRAQYPAADSVAGPVLEPETDEGANHAPDPNRIPYETDTNIGEQALALPATIWNGVASVFRAAVLYTEFSGLLDKGRIYLQNEPPIIVLPSLSVGGREGFSGGATLYLLKDRVLGTDRAARVGARYGVNTTYSAFARVSDHSLFGTPLYGRIDGGYYSDGNERFYPIGNDTDEDERIDYAYREGIAEVNFELPLAERISVTAVGGYRHFEVLSADDAVPFPSSTPGFGSAGYLSAGAGVVVDFSEAGGLHAERTYQGTALLAEFRYGKETSDLGFAYQRYAVELRQYLPVPFLAFDRRLALRGRIEQAQAPGANIVPFYELSTLGGPATLRGYAYDRFRDRGSLLFTAEYRWPIFDIFDAAIFYDAGQVFKEYEDIGLDRFHYDAGGGLHVYGGGGVAARLEVAFSPEGPRLIAQVGTTF